MLKIRLICAESCLSLLALGGWTSAIGSARASADAANPGAFDDLDYINNTFSVAAFSEEFNPLINQFVQNTDPSGAVKFNGSGSVVGTAPPGYYTARGGALAIPGGGTYKPSVTLYYSATNSPGTAALKKSLLESVGDYATVTSNTGDYTGDAGAVITQTENLLQAQATTGGAPPLPGSAAGQAIDPLTVPSGSYAYNPTVQASLTVTPSDSSGGVSIFAVDSSTFTSDSVANFEADGAPLAGTLWNLSISDSSAIPDPANLGIDFELNPLALNEITFPSSFLATLSYSTTAQEVAAIDQAIDQSIEAGFTVTGDELDLAEMDPFPAGTMFSPSVASDDYSDGVSAQVAGVPEPSPGLILLSAVGVGILGRRKRFVF